MRLTGVYAVPAPPAQVWNMLMDPTVIASCLPGCKTFESIGPDEYRAVMTAAVGAIGGSFSGTVRIADQNPPQSYRLLVDGRGTPGFAKGEALITLRQTPDGTALDVEASATVGGLVAQVGQRLLGAVTKMMMDRFFSCLKSAMEPPAHSS
jgi:carbon monoxide dehydrogenase subunit G